MNGAVIGNVKLFIKKWFGSRYMAYNLDKKLKEFEFERKQVLHHLALLDANIATLKRAIELTQQESDVVLYNTDNFVYRSKYKLFKGNNLCMVKHIILNETQLAKIYRELEKKYQK